MRPGRPTPSPTTAPAPAPMNINAKVPMNSARSLGVIRLDMLLSRDENSRWRDLRQGQRWFGGPTARASTAGWRSDQAYSAAIMLGLKLMPSAFATPAP